MLTAFSRGLNFVDYNRRYILHGLYFVEKTKVHKIRKKTIRAKTNPLRVGRKQLIITFYIIKKNQCKDIVTFINFANGISPLKNLKFHLI